MKVALVHDWMTASGGAEQVLLAFHELFPEAPIYTSYYFPEKLPQFAKAKVITSYLPTLPLLSRRDKLAIPLMPAAFEAFDLKGYDLIISSGAFAKGVITHPGQVHMNYCHTPIRYIWGLGGDTRNAGKWDSWLREKAAHTLRLWDVVSSERVDHFIANSSTVQARIKKIYRREAEVISPPVDTEKFVLSEAPGEYYLSVGRLVAYKNVHLIAAACNGLRVPLKIAGSGPFARSVQMMAGGSRDIELLGRVSDAELKKLYAGAKAFIFAAEEDAGIVPLEAMACGKPVIAYGKGGVLDVVREGKEGVFFPEPNIDSIKEAISKFEGMQFDPHAIRKQAEHFSIQIFKEKIRATLKKFE